MIDEIFSARFACEKEVIKKLLPLSKFNSSENKNIISRAQKLVQKIRSDNSFSIEEFISRCSLSTDEGIAVIALAEALLRIPDNFVSKELIYDKLSDKHWEDLIFKKTKSFKTLFAVCGLYISGKFTDFAKYENILSNLLERIGKTALVKILKNVILFLSKEFVFAVDMAHALHKTKNYDGYKFAFDLLGESARTMEQADIYYKQYNNAIDLISKAFPKGAKEISKRPNLSVKLTALYPRFELIKKDEIEENLYPKVVSLVKKIRDNNLSITFDAEESHRLDIYLLFLTKLISDPEFKDFNGIGIVVQSYCTSSYKFVEYIGHLAQKLGKKIPVRLVKGAYWDSEIKHAQEKCLKYYPVFTKKEYTDVSYIACAKKMLESNDFIESQFATHNALTASAVMEIGKNKEYEFQKLYGMGNILHQEINKEYETRIYAPVGEIKDLLAYLMRRILENGASANFVSKVSSDKISLKEIAHNINDKALSELDGAEKIVLPEDIYKYRKNAMGYDLGYKTDYDYIYEKVSSYFNKVHEVGSIINGKEILHNKHNKENFCPAKNAERFSLVSSAVPTEIKEAISSAEKEFTKWSNIDVESRAKILEKMANIFEDNKFELYSLLIKEAGKSIHDAVNEVIEAVDFCRYYASSAKLLMKEKLMPGLTGETNLLTMHPRGVFLCISPWNFPFAIYIGQIVAALAVGNTVIAKPSDQTPVIANFVAKLMYKAGLPKSALQLVITSGSNISKYAVIDERISGVAFTGSCHTAKNINIALANRDSGIVPFIAETGGLNAMIVDSSALLEQVTDDVLMSAFYSAGQRCSALRILYIQEEIYDELVEMIKGATKLLKIGDTSDFSVDIGSLITNKAKEELEQHIEDMNKKGFSVFSHPHNNQLSEGNYFYPHIIEVNSINDIPDEKFGPILHIAKYQSKKLDKVIDEINSSGFGLTFGIHSRIEEKIEYIRKKMKAGNIYANRSIIGAKVESQPFGGENKSGTGFKAGGPNYLLKFMTERTTSINTTAFGGNVDLLKE